MANLLGPHELDYCYYELEKGGFNHTGPALREHIEAQAAKIKEYQDLGIRLEFIIKTLQSQLVNSEEDKEYLDYLQYLIDTRSMSSEYKGLSHVLGFEHRSEIRKIVHTILGNLTGDSFKKWREAHAR